MKFFCRFAVAIALFFAIPSALSAASLSIQVVQHSKGQGKIFETTRVIEDSMLGYFFENGWIVSNSPIAVSQIGTDDDEQIFYKGSDDAYYGSIRYFVTVYVDFVDLSASRNPDAVVISNISKISWKTVDVKTNAEIDHGSGKVKTSAQKNDDGERRVSSFAAEVAARILREIK